jgi:hypothetical protein
MAVDPATSLTQLRADYRAACRASNEIVAAIGDPAYPVTRHGKVHDLRWVLLNVLQEVSRHAGQADVIREQIDGRTGR